MPAATHPRIRADIHRLRLGYHCATEIFRNQAICNHCETPTAAPLLHYILQCAETASIRRQGNFPDEDEDVARSTATRLIANAPIHRLIKLVQETPPPRFFYFISFSFFFFFFSKSCPNGLRGVCSPRSNRGRWTPLSHGEHGLHPSCTNCGATFKHVQSLAPRGTITS